MAKLWFVRRNVFRIWFMTALHCFLVRSSSYLFVKFCVLFNKLCAKSAASTKLVLNFSLSLWSSMLNGTRTRKTRLSSYPTLAWYVVWYFKKSNGRSLSHCFRNFPEDIFSDVSIEVCVLTKTPIVSTCFVVAWQSVISRLSAISCVTFKTKTDFLSNVVYIVVLYQVDDFS